LYRVNLDDWRSVRAHLQQFPLTGAMRMLGRFASHRHLGDWHYSGTFFWIRHALAFGQKALDVQRFYGGVEAWPGMHFAREATGCLALDGLRQLPYYPEFWSSVGEPAVKRWEAALRPIPPPPDLARPLPYRGLNRPRLEQHPDEMAWYMENLLAVAPARMLTIGARHGGLEWHIARTFREAGRDLEITTIELNPGPEL
jgi:hypothetical protein